MDMKVCSRLRAAIGQGLEQKQAQPERIVRVRSGREVRRGCFRVGDEGCIAFVWQDEEAAVPERVLVVQASLGGACLRENNEPVTLKALFPGRKALHRLETRFAVWQRLFEKRCDPEKPRKFWWSLYHQEGRELARQVQAELVDEVVVRYLRPELDPQHRFSPEIAL